jgi:hypothetical protein
MDAVSSEYQRRLTAHEAKQFNERLVRNPCLEEFLRDDRIRPTSPIPWTHADAHWAPAEHLRQHPPSSADYSPHVYLERRLRCIEARIKRRESGPPQLLVRRLQLHIQLHQYPASRITPTWVRQQLKRWHLPRYYRNAAFLARKLNPSYTAPSIPPLVHQQLAQLFRHARRVYFHESSRRAPRWKVRRYFLSYGNFAYLALRWLGHASFAHHFRMTRMKTERNNQHQARVLRLIWKEIHP